MKRVDLIRHLRMQGCRMIREGSNHSVFFNPETEAMSTVPRHGEIDAFLGRKICKDLGIPAIRKK